MEYYKVSTDLKCYLDTFAHDKNPFGRFLKSLGIQQS